jgi:hypothetical protein
MRVVAMQELHAKSIVGSLTVPCLPCRMNPVGHATVLKVLDTQNTGWGITYRVLFTQVQ